MKIVMKKMKASLALVLALLLAISVFPVGGLLVAAADPNVIFSDDFEDVAVGTTGRWTPSGEMLAQVKTGVGKDFSKGLLIGEGSGKWSTLTYYFTAEANTNYEISYDYYESTTAETVQVQVRLAEQSVTLYSSDRLESTGGMWKHFTGTFSTEEITNLRLLVVTDGILPANDKALDNFVIRKVGESVFEDDFENTTAGTIGDWTNGNDATSAVKSASGKDLSKGLNVSGPRWAYTRVKVTLEPNTDYEVSYDYYESTETANVHVCVSRTDGGIVHFYESEALGNTGGVWKHYVGTFNSDDQSEAWLSINLDAAVNGGDKSFDNFVIRKTDTPVEYSKTVVEADFESGDLSSWAMSDTMKASIKPSIGKDFSKGLSIDEGAGKWQTIRYYFTAEENAYYEIDFDYYESTNAETVQVLVRSDEIEYFWKSDRLGSTKGEWEHYNARFYIGSHETTNLRLVICTDGIIGANDKAFDNFVIRRVEASVFEDDFESADVGTSGQWENAQKATSVVKNAVGMNMSKGLVVNGPKWSRTRVSLTLEPYTNYEISYDYYESTTTDSSRVTVRAKNTDPIVDVYFSDSHGNTKGQWQHYSAVFNTEDLTDFWLMIQLDETVEGSDKVYDNFIIRKTSSSSDDEEEEKVGLINGDFETGEFDPWEGGNKMAIVTDDVHGGDYAAKVVGGQWAGIGQYVDVTPNTDYRFSFWVRYESGSNAQACYIMDGKASKNLYVYDVKPGKTAGWTKYEFVFNSGDQSKLLLSFKVTASKESALVYDDVTFTPLGAVQFDGYLYNGSFETGDKAKWDGGASFDIVTDAQDGSYALHLSGDGYANIGQAVPTKANTDYSVVVWAKKVNGNGKFAILYKDKNETKNVESFYIDPTDEWAKYVVTFNTGDYPEGHVLLMADSTKNTAYVDNISMMEGKPINWNGIIGNGDFESGDMTNWENVGSESEVIKTEGAYDGEYALNLKGGQWSSIRQTVKTKVNTEYTLTFYVKRMAGADGVAVWLKDGDKNLLDPDGNEIGGVFDVSEADGWLKVEHTFNSFDRTTVDVLFGLMNNGNEYLIDGIHLATREKPTAKPLTLYSFGQVNNRPQKAEDNLIVNGGFESTEGAQWKTYTFMDDTVSVIEDANAMEGNKVLYFNSSAVSEKTKHVFWVTVEPNTNYTFSAFVKGAYLSKDNLCTATFGVVDPDTENFLIYSGERNKNSKTTYQLVPPCWDNEWHLRSVAFNSGEKTKIGIAIYGASSQMYLDDIALYKSDAGEKYIPDVMSGVISAKIGTYAGCDPEDNLVGNFNLNDAKDTFWSTGYGWKNGTLDIYEDEYGYRNSLRYTASDNPVGVHYIKWIDVEPNTAYTFSLDMKILESGSGYLALIDSKPSKPIQFVNLSFDKDAFGEDWFDYFVDFNTDSYDRIGIVIVDKGGQALFDNIRIFKAEDGKDVVDDYVPEKTGWEQDGSKWIYFEDGEQVYGKWIKDGGAWYYIDADGYMVANKWMKDSNGWCWLTASGKMATNAWVKDSKGWCYVDGSGYCVTNTWMKDSVGWCYLDENGSMVKNEWVVDGDNWYLLDANGYMISNKWVHDGFGWVYLESSGKLAFAKWVKDSKGWCYVDENGYCVTSTWKKDSNGWCYLGADGYMATNKWIKDSQGWCYVGANGYCVTNCWKKDSKGWVYLDASGRMVTNKWVKDSVGWCYVGADGYAVTNCWKKDSTGWCYLNASGSMTKNAWVKDGANWYYLDGNGYMVTGKSLKIGNKTYNFNASGVCTNP